MPLVDYSSSDSEAEPQEAKTAPSQQNKPSFQKVVSGESRKIVVNLPQLSAEDDTEDHASKRPRTTGAFSGLNYFLPAPKRSGQAAQVSSNGLKKGISLKTGAEPAFDRSALTRAPAAIDDPEPEPEPEPELEEEDDVTYADDDSTATAQTPVVTASVKSSTPRFRPLSVARKAKKPSKPQRKEPVSSSIDSEKIGMPNPKKSSLFSIPIDDRPGPESLIYDTKEYKPLVYVPEVPESSTDMDLIATDDFSEVSQSLNQSEASRTAPSLDSIASDLNLTPSERRRLLGRQGAVKGGIQVKSFNLDNEYAKNRAMIESGEAAPAVNPVRAIAPGRHSIHQLLNAATSQREALEESFAAGKRVRKEAGSKYGW